MSSIHISRDRKQLGEFTEDQVVHGLMNGEFFPSDLAWREGMEEWQPLSELKLVEAALSKPPPAEDVATPGGLLTTPVNTASIPWENGEGGALAKWWQTTAGGLFSPIKTFSRMPVTGGYGQPLLYLLVTAIAASFFVTALFGIVVLLFLPAIASQEGGTAAAAGMGLNLLVNLISSVIGTAISVVILVFVGGGIMHLCLLLFGGAGRGFEATCRAICYSYGAAYALYFVPVLGMIAAIFWTPIIYTIALKEAHQTDYWRVILALLLPALVCCGLMVLAFGALGSLVASFSEQGF